MPDEPTPHDSAADEQPTPPTETDLNPIDTLPHRLGFEETQLLEGMRSVVLTVIEEGTSERLRNAWIAFQQLGEQQVEAAEEVGKNTPQVQIGMLIYKAAVLRDGEEPVLYLEDLMHANIYANGMDLHDVIAVLEAELVRYRDSGEMLQARGEYDDALDAYIEHEQGDLSDRERGFLNLRMAECYVGLGYDPDSALLEGSVATAMECFAGMPEQRRVERLMDDLYPTPT